MIDILINSFTMDSQVKSHTTKLSGSVQADTFRLEADLRSHHLTIVLKDLIKWKIYAKKYTKDDIGKEINLKVQLEDIFSAVTCSDDSQAKDKKPIFYTYKFGDIINSPSSQLKIEENGKVTIINTIFHQRAGNMVQKKETSILNLQVLGDIKEADKIEMVKQNLKRQMELKYEKQIENQHTENQKMKEQMQKMQKEIELLKKGEKKQEVKTKNFKKFIIHAKTLTGIIHNIQVSSNSTIQTVKQLISDMDGAPPDELRLIYAGAQMQDGRILSDYNIYSEVTIHVVKRLRGSIGIFDVYLNSPCRDLLSEKINERSSQRYKQIQQMVEMLKGDINSQFKMFQLTEIQCGKLKQLIMLSESKYQEKLNQDAPEQWIEDLKIKLVRTTLVELIGEELCKKLQRLFNDQYDEIVVRRCKAHGKMINFHTDVSQKTMQVALNDETEYEGGRLLFVSKGILNAPERMTGTVTIHDNTIVHGVTLLESGVRYGLFFLKK